MSQDNLTKVSSGKCGALKFNVWQGDGYAIYECVTDDGMVLAKGTGENAKAAFEMLKASIIGLRQDMDDLYCAAVDASNELVGGR